MKNFYTRDEMLYFRGWNRAIRTVQEQAVLNGLGGFAKFLEPLIETLPTSIAQGLDPTAVPSHSEPEDGRQND